MKHIMLIFFLFILALQDMNSQAYTEVDKAGLLELTGKNNDTTYVINFWATWCSPCVKEIGYFEELHRSFQDDKLRVILVSLDFPGQAASRLPGFMKEKDITAPVLLMTDHKYNEWIDLVDPSWSGAIPATLVIRGDQRAFMEKELTRDELFKAVNQIHN